jgi:DivIVA domain-containing protein
MLVWVVVIIALTGAVVAVAVGRGGTMSEVYDDRPDATVPAGRPLTSDDLRDVRFSTAVRGYRMDEVDALLARLRADLIARESLPPGEQVRVVEAPADPVEPDGPVQRLPAPQPSRGSHASPPSTPAATAATAAARPAADDAPGTPRHLPEAARHAGDPVEPPADSVGS